MKRELALERVLAIWWAFTWRAALSSSALGAVLGFVGAYFMAAAGSPESGRGAAMILAWLGSVPCSIWAFRAALSKDYGGFRVQVAEREIVQPGPPSSPATVGQAAPLEPLSTPPKAIEQKVITRPEWIAAGALLAVPATLLILVALTAPRSSPTEPGGAAGGTVPSDANLSTPAAVTNAPTAGAASVAAPVPPIDEHQIDSGVQEYDRVQSKSGILGAQTYSVGCFEAAAKSKKLGDLDFCVAFDDAASFVDDKTEANLGFDRAPYFEQVELTKRHLEAFGALVLDQAAVQQRLADLQTRAQQAIVQVVLARHQSQEAADPANATPASELASSTTTGQ